MLALGNPQPDLGAVEGEVMTLNSGQKEVSITTVAARKVLAFVLVIGPMLVVTMAFLRQFLFEAEAWQDSATTGIFFAAAWGLMHGLMGVWRMKTDPERFKSTSSWSGLGLRKQQ